MNRLTINSNLKEKAGGNVHGHGHCKRNFMSLTAGIINYMYVHVWFDILAILKK